METSAALAQIKACMASPINPVPCVLLRANGTCEEIVSDHRKLGQLLGGPPTVVGGIISLGVMGVAIQGSKGKKNKNILPESSWESNIKGDIILFRVDDDGGSAPFTLDEHRKWVDKGMPDCDQEKEDDEDKCSEEDASSEDDEESSEDDEDEETLEEFTERMQELPVAELRKACRVLELNEKGSRLQILARLHAHAQENVEIDEDEDEIEDENEKIVKNVNMTPSKAPTPVKAKAKPKSLGPVKTIAKARKAS